MWAVDLNGIKTTVDSLRHQHILATQINLFGNAILKKIMQSIFLLFVLFSLSGCIAATVVSAAVGVTTTIVGGAIDVIDTVTPDIFDDNEEEEGDKGDNKND